MSEKSTDPIIIEVKKIGKKYNIVHQRGGYIALRDIISNILKSPFAFLRTKARQAVGKETNEEFWALKDISFNIHKGEVMGIIGKNGAGKSTLLKILSKITPPTTGEIVLKGRVGSLLEVGTGFHPELTGRENIFLNGAILGMGKKEIAGKFDEIVKFAGVEKFLDTPVKHYSSGMYVRLAFSVAAHMEPDILIVDEVLAVGDTEFQKKCLGKMEEVTKKDKRTILFVSHNMSAVKQLCSEVIWIENGKIKMIGPTAKVIDEYMGFGKNTEERAEYASLKFDRDASKKIQILGMSLQRQDGLQTIEMPVGENFFLEIDYVLSAPAEGLFISAIIFSDGNQRTADFMEIDTNPEALKEKPEGIYKTKIKIPGIFNANIYNIMVVFERGRETLDKRDGLPLKIVDTKNRIYDIRGRANIISEAEWQTTRL